MKKILNRNVGNLGLCIALLSSVLIWSVNQHVLAEPTSAPASEKVDSVDTLVNGLRARLEKNPNDPQGWSLLAKSYHFLQRWEEYHDVVSQAKALGYNVGADSKITTSSSIQNNKTHRVSGMSSVVAQEIAQISGDPKTTTAKGIAIKIDIHPSVLSKVSPDTAVFVFARSAIKLGPPLAVAKREVSDLPLEMVLDDSMAMIKTRNISSAETVIVGARIALSGSPMKKDGDIEVISEAVMSNTDEIVELNFE